MHNAHKMQNRKIDKLINYSFDCRHCYAIRNESCSNIFFEFEYTIRKYVLRFFYADRDCAND